MPKTPDQAHGPRWGPRIPRCSIPEMKRLPELRELAKTYVRNVTARAALTVRPVPIAAAAARLSGRSVAPDARARGRTGGPKRNRSLSFAMDGAGAQPVLQAPEHQCAAMASAVNSAGTVTSNPS